MKKLLILILFFISLASYSQIQNIGVGTVPNDGTGDPLRTAFIKVNNNFSYHAGLIDLKANLASPTFTGAPLAPTAAPGTNTTQIATTAFARIETSGQIADSLADLLDRAASVNTIVPVWATDTANAPGSIITFTQLQSFTGGGGTAGKYYEVSGRVGGLGFPSAGDSTDSHSSWIGRKLIVSREGNEQQQHADNTEEDGFRFDNVTGIVTFRPVLADREQLIYRATNTIQYESLTAEGGGGEAESVLLDSIRAYWQMEEDIGVTLSEKVGGYNGTLYGSGVLGNPGKVGLSVKVLDNGAVVIPYNSALAVVGDRLSISVWFYLTTLPSVSGVRNTLFTLWDNTYHIAHTLSVFTDNKVWGEIHNSTADEHYVSSTSTVSTGQWYNATLVCEGTGRTLKMYLDGVQSEGNIFNGTLHSFDGNITIGNQQSGNLYWFRGYIDEVGYWYQRLTPADILLLKPATTGTTYPFVP